MSSGNFGGSSFDRDGEVILDSELRTAVRQELSEEKKNDGGAAPGTRGLQLAGQILELARRDGVTPGERLFEHRLAQRLGVSRGPVRTGLKELAAAGLVSQVPNKGYILAQPLDSKPAFEALSAPSASEQQYMAIADDRFEGWLPDIVSENELMRRYQLKRPDVLRLLNRIAAEGWVDRLPGYGWKFAQTLSSPDAYAQTTRFRMMIEPAGILEPAFKLHAADAARIYDQQERVLNGGFKVFLPAEIFRFGCEFHETIGNASGNPFLLESLRRINSIRRLFAYRSVIPDHVAIARQAREHLQLLDLLGADRRKEAADFMLWHLQDAAGRGTNASEGATVKATDY
jgi:DNA-binding GntR family transcriptional regulator